MTGRLIDAAGWQPPPVPFTASLLPAVDKRKEADALLRKLHYGLIFASLPAAELSIVVVSTMGPTCKPGVAFSTLIFKKLVKLLTPETLIPELFK